MKNLLRAVFGTALLAVAVLASAHAQAPANIYAAGISANPGQQPSVSGTAFWGHSVGSAGTYVGSIADILPQTVRPIVVNTNIGAVVAQRVVTIGKLDLYGIGSTGISLTGSNTGWNYTGGGAVFIPLPKPNWFISANVRFSKSSVAGATGYQLIPGVQIAWGK